MDKSLLLYDGFRNDYLDRGITPTLNNFRDNSVYAPYLMTVYPALGEANIHSISTGLYPRSHPYITRKDERENEKILKDIVNNKITSEIPIWILNQKKGGKSACMMWWASELDFKGGRCDLVQKYDKSWSLRRRADQVIEWLNVTDITQRPNLVLFYVEELDRISHFFGTLSRNTTLMIRRLDLLTKYIFNKLMELDLYHTTNIMILSDHGVRSIMRDNSFNEIYTNKSFPYPDYKYPNKIEVTGDVNGVFIIEQLGDNDDKEKYIKTTNLFKREGDIVPDLTVVSVPRGFTKNMIIEYAALPGFLLDSTRLRTAKWTEKYGTMYPASKFKAPLDDPDRPYGVHGYLRQNDAIFMAKGPQFTRFKKVEPFLPVDLYSAFTKLLGIQGDYEMEGNFSRVLPIFHVQRKVHWPPILLTIAGLAVITTVIFQLLIQQFLERAG